MRLGVRGDDAERVAARLGELVAETEGPPIPAFAAHATARQAADPEGLDRASATLADLGFALHAADAAAQAAVGYLAEGRGGPAHLADARALALTRDCEGARTPALALAGRDQLRGALAP